MSYQRPKLAPGTVVYMTGSAGIYSSTVNWSVSEADGSVNYHMHGIVGTYRQHELHLSFNAALAALEKK